MQRLAAAVQRHGRTWVAVATELGTKTNQQCQDKVANEVALGRMPEPSIVRKRTDEANKAAPALQRPTTETKSTATLAGEASFAASANEAGLRGDPTA